jgi:mannose-6-phosphate isomerase-like protein (cupin superfamily)
MNKRIIKVSDCDKNYRDGYYYRRLIAQDEHPYNFLHITVDGNHAARQVVHGIRNYYVVSGEGAFVFEGNELPVETETLIVIQPGEVYSYYGRMTLIEFNIPTDGKIAHKDIA